MNSSVKLRTRPLLFESEEDMAHGWVGLGRIVYVSSSEQLAAWLAEFGAPAPPVRTLPIRDVVPALVVEGPVPDLAVQVRDLHRRFHSSS